MWMRMLMLLMLLHRVAIMERLSLSIVLRVLRWQRRTLPKASSPEHLLELIAVVRVVVGPLVSDWRFTISLLIRCRRRRTAQRRPISTLQQLVSAIPVSSVGAVAHRVFQRLSSGIFSVRRPLLHGMRQTVGRELVGMRLLAAISNTASVARCVQLLGQRAPSVGKQVLSTKGIVHVLALGIVSWIRSHPLQITHFPNGSARVLPRMDMVVVRRRITARSIHSIIGIAKQIAHRIATLLLRFRRCLLPILRRIRLRRSGGQ